MPIPYSTKKPDENRIPTSNQTPKVQRCLDQIRRQRIPIRTVQELADGMTSALDQGHPSMDLYIDIGRLHFVADPNPYNFNDFQLDTPFPTVRPPAAATGSALDINALVAALVAHTAALGSAALAPPGGLAAPAESIPVTNIRNYRALPSDVRLRFDQPTGRKMMTRSVI